MKIINLGIANFRSFDSEGIVIENLKKINIFIGKNNSGKSNILRFLNLCFEAYRKKTELTESMFNLFRAEFDKYENYFLGKNNNLEIAISIRPEDFYKKLTKYVNPDDLLTMKIDLFDGKVIEKCEIFEKLNAQELLSFSRENQIAFSNKDQSVEELNKLLAKKVMYYFSDLSSKIILIPNFRKISEQKEDQESNIVDGKNIISKLFVMQNPAYRNEENKLKFLKIQEFVRNLLDDPNITIEIPHDKKNMLVEMNGYRRPLESFGTGIHELVIMCSALALYEKRIVCIEEPEIHLHPYLQRKFINFLLYKTDNNYFITTHSNVFLDFNEDTSIYHVTYNELKTTVSFANTSEKCCAILDDLGYKASDLLQANGIIWVEGPSDRIFLNRWIKLLNNRLNVDFVEGIHYSIMFYGGKLLTHISMKPFQFFNDEFIYLLKLNRKAMIIIDRDGISPDSKLNQTKARINAETKRGNCWITKGREIENYLSKNTLIQWLNEKHPNIPKSKIKVQEDENKKLQEIILSSSSKIKIKYNEKKVEYSKEIIKHIDDKDLDIWDLKHRLNFLIKNIEEWNYIEPRNE